MLFGYLGGLAAARAKSDLTVKRGTRIEDGARLQRRRRRRSRAGQGGHALTLAGIPIPPMDETKHFKMIGTTGTGKSTAIRELLEGALARGDRAVIADPDGGYLATASTTPLAATSSSTPSIHAPTPGTSTVS